MTQGWIGASDGDFLRDPAGVISLSRGALGDLTGWALDAPRAVPFDRARTVPLVLARRLSLGEDAAVNWSREATLVVSRWEGQLDREKLAAVLNAAPGELAARPVEADAD